MDCKKYSAERLFKYLFYDMYKINIKYLIILLWSSLHAFYEYTLYLRDCKEIRPVSLKGNWPWIFIERTVTEAEAPILWPPDVKNLLIGKDPGAGKNWEQEEKEVTKDEMIRWHQQLNGHEFEQTLRDSGGLAWCSPWSFKGLDVT